MKDVAPRIFRSLERPLGQEFDTVVVAAVSAYGSLRKPTTQQAQDFGRLVCPLWGRTTTETRRHLAATLSHTEVLPRSIVDLLMEAPVEIAAPFLISSPALTTSDLDKLAAGGDASVTKLIQGRLERARQGPAPRRSEAASVPDTPVQSVSAPETGTNSTPIIASPSLAPEFLSETPFMPTAEAPARPRADSARETLRRLVSTGRQTPPSSSIPTFADLFDAAMAKNESEFYQLIGEIFGLSPEALLPIAEDPTGERLAVVLRALKASPADALSVLMLLKPAVGLDVMAFDAMTRFYRNLRPEDCRALLAASRLPSSFGRRRPDADSEAPRRDFGRRKEPPAIRRTGSEQ